MRALFVFALLHHRALRASNHGLEVRRERGVLARERALRRLRVRVEAEVLDRLKVARPVRRGGRANVAEAAEQDALALALVQLLRNLVDRKIVRVITKPRNLHAIHAAEPEASERERLVHAPDALDVARNPTKVKSVLMLVDFQEDEDVRRTADGTNHEIDPGVRRGTPILEAPELDPELAAKMTRDGCRIVVRGVHHVPVAEQRLRPALFLLLLLLNAFGRVITFDVLLELDGRHEAHAARRLGTRMGALVRMSEHGVRF